MDKIDYNLHYNIIYFNTNYEFRGKQNRDEYNAICMRDAETMKDVTIVQGPMSDSSDFLRKLYFYAHSAKLNRIIKMPEQIWFPLIYRSFPKTNKPFCFVLADNGISLKYAGYLRNRFPGCRLVKTHRDLLKWSHLNPEHTEENLNRIFDLRLAYDPNDAEKYGISHFDEIESKIDLEISDNYPLSDVFFAGQAKDRLEKIVEAYDLFTSKGLKCDFVIVHIAPEKRIHREGIVYLDKFMPYKEMLERSVNSRCMFDVNQGGAVGYTSRFLEAVMYNKLFITDNPAVKETKYFKTGNILFFDKVSEIDPTFISSKTSVEYNYTGEFSPIHLIKQIDDELTKKFND